MSVQPARELQLPCSSSRRCPAGGRSLRPGLAASFLCAAALAAPAELLAQPGHGISVKQVLPTDDVYVLGGPDPNDPNRDLNFNGEPLLWAQKQSIPFGGLAVSLLRFPNELDAVASVTRATLTLRSAGSTGSSAAVTAQLVPSGQGWTEQGVTWATQPAADPEAGTATLNPSTVFGAPDVFDVTPLVQKAHGQGHGTFEFRIAMATDEQFVFWDSKETAGYEGAVLSVECDVQPPCAQLRVTRLEVVGTPPARPGSSDVTLGLFRLTADEKDGFTVSSLTLQASAPSGGVGFDGDEAQALGPVGLYLDSDGNGRYTPGTDVQLGQAQSFAEQNGQVAFGGLALSLAAGQSVDVVLAADVAPAACLGDAYLLHVAAVAAAPQSLAPCDPVVAALPSEKALTALEGGVLQMVSGDGQSADKGQPAAQPLQVRVLLEADGAAPDPDCAKVLWRVRNQPAGAQAMLSVAGGAAAEQVQTSLDATGLSEPVSVTLGHKTGNYEIEASYAVGPTTNRLGVFTLTSTGIDLTGVEYDGQAGLPLATFLQSVEADNEITVQVVTGSAPTPARVELQAGGQRVSARKATRDTSSWKAALDMGDMGSGNVELQIQAYDAQDTPIASETAAIQVIAFPAWAQRVLSFVGADLRFLGAAGYKASFDYPPSLEAFGFTVPAEVLVLGGKDNGSDFGFRFTTEYRLDESSAFSGSGSFTTEILDRPVEASLTVGASFDRAFRFSGGNAALEASTSFGLPEVSASRTVLIYGVPLTLEVEVGGDVIVRIGGSSSMDAQFRVTRVAVTPGVTVRVDITLSASLLLGAAKLAFVAHPTASMDMDVEWSEGQSAAAGELRGSFVIPFEVIGSLFWGLASGTLYEDEFGPWSFGTGGRGTQRLAQAQRLRVLRGAESSIPAFLGRQDLAARPEGEALLVYTSNAAVDGAAPDAEVYWRRLSGGEWSAEQRLTNNDLWELDPQVAFLGDSRAVAVWTSNDGDPDLAAQGASLGQILAHQDLAYSVFEAGEWSEPKLFVDDDRTDGAAALAGGGGTALVAWLHDPDTEASIPGGRGTDGWSRTDWEIHWSRFDGSAWSAPEALTADTASDSQAAVAVAADGGEAVVVWATDQDGVPATRQDTSLRLARWSEAGGMSDPQLLHDGAQEVEGDPAAAFTPDGRAVAVWVGRLRNELDPGASAETLYLAVHEEGGWSEPLTLDSNPYFLAEPALEVSDEGVATVVYRVHDGYEGALASVEVDLSGPARAALAPREAVRRLLAPSQAGVTQWQPGLGLWADGTPLVVYSRLDWRAGVEHSGPGLSGGRNWFEVRERGSVAGVGSEEAVDPDEDGRFEELVVEVELDLLEAGDYRVTAALSDASGNLIAEAAAELAPAAAGRQTVRLAFPGPLLNSHGADGPYFLGRLRLFSLAATPVLVDEAAAHQTAAYLAASFEPGALAFDRQSYASLQEVAVLTLEDTAFDRDPEREEVVQARLTSTADAREGLLVELVETGPATGVFRGSVGFTTGASGQGRISVVEWALLEAKLEAPAGPAWKARASFSTGAVDPVPVVQVSEAACWAALLILVAGCLSVRVGRGRPNR